MAFQYISNSWNRLAYFCVILLYASYTLAAPASKKISIYDQFNKFLVENTCEINPKIIVPFSKQSNSSLLESELQICKTEDSLINNTPVNTLCNEIFEALSNVTCNTKEEPLPPINIALSSEVCKDFEKMKGMISGREDSLGQKLTDTMVCEFACVTKFNQACQVLLWTYQVLNEIERARAESQKIKEHLTGSEAGTPKSEIQTSLEQNKKNPLDKSSSQNDIHEEGTKSNIGNIGQAAGLGKKAGLAPNEAENREQSKLHQDVKDKTHEKKKLDTQKLISSQEQKTNENVEVIDHTKVVNTDVKEEKNGIDAKVRNDEENVRRTDKPQTNNEKNQVDISISKTDKMSPESQMKNDVIGNLSVNAPNLPKNIEQSEDNNLASVPTQPVENEQQENIHSNPQDELEKNKSVESNAAKENVEPAVESNNNVEEVDHKKIVGTDVKEEKNGIDAEVHNDQKQTMKEKSDADKLNDPNTEQKSSTVDVPLEQMETGNEARPPVDKDQYIDEMDDFEDEYSRSDYGSLPVGKDNVPETRQKPETVPSTLNVDKSSASRSFDDFQSRSHISQGIADIQTPIQDQEQGNFLFYFITLVFILMAGYVIFHNKQKIIALIVEGRIDRRRRSHGVGYKKLETK